MAKYCTKCGNTGWLLDNTPCDCQMSREVFTADISMLDVPDQYQGIRFNKDIVDPSMGSFYSDYLYKIWSEIVSMKLKSTNILICSPKATSKTVMAYSALQELFRKGTDTFPIYDLLEVRRITVDMDLGKRQKYTQENPEDILRVPYLFVKVPEFCTNDVFAMLSVLIDRRTRRNGCTIFLYDGSLTNLKSMDYKGIIESISKDGSYGTLLCKEFWRKDENKTNA